MNTTVGPIFNKNFAEKVVCGSHEQCTRPTKQCIITWNTLLIKKKKKTAKTQTLAAVSKRVPNQHLLVCDYMYWDSFKGK